MKIICSSYQVQVFLDKGLWEFFELRVELVYVNAYGLQCKQTNLILLLLCIKSIAFFDNYEAYKLGHNYINRTYCMTKLCIVLKTT